MRSYTFMMMTRGIVCFPLDTDDASGVIFDGIAHSPVLWECKHKMFADSVVARVSVVLARHSTPSMTVEVVVAS